MACGLYKLIQPVFPLPSGGVKMPVLTRRWEKQMRTSLGLVWGSKYKSSFPTGF